MIADKLPARNAALIRAYATLRTKHQSPIVQTDSDKNKHLSLISNENVGKI